MTESNIEIKHHKMSNESKLKGFLTRLFKNIEKGATI